MMQEPVTNQSATSRSGRKKKAAVPPVPSEAPLPSPRLRRSLGAAFSAQGGLTDSYQEMVSLAIRHGATNEEINAMLRGVGALREGDSLSRQCLWKHRRALKKAEPGLAELSDEAWQVGMAALNRTVTYWGKLADAVYKRMLVIDAEGEPSFREGLDVKELNALRQALNDCSRQLWTMLSGEHKQTERYLSQIKMELEKEVTQRPGLTESQRAALIVEMQTRFTRVLQFVAQAVRERRNPMADKGGLMDLFRELKITSIIPDALPDPSLTPTESQD